MIVIIALVYSVIRRNLQPDDIAGIQEIYGSSQE